MAKTMDNILPDNPKLAALQETLKNGELDSEDDEFVKYETKL
jgi:hypothetical protein